LEIIQLSAKLRFRVRVLGFRPVETQAKAEVIRV